MLRITRVTNTFWDSPRSVSPIVINSRSERYIDPTKDEQIYHREQRARKEWTILEWGWIKSPSFITITNLESLDVQPPTLIKKRQEKLRQIRSKNPTIDSGSLRSMLQIDAEEFQQSEEIKDDKETLPRILEVLMVHKDLVHLWIGNKITSPTLFLFPREIVEICPGPDLVTAVRSRNEDEVRFVFHALPG